VVTVLHHNPKPKIPIVFFMGRMRSYVDGKTWPALLAFYFPRCCLIVRLGVVLGRVLLNAMSPLLQNSRVLLNGDKVQLNRGILTDRPYKIMSGCGIRNAQQELVGCRGSLGYESNMISSSGLQNFNLTEDFNNDWENPLLAYNQIITTTMKIIGPIVTTDIYGDVVYRSQETHKVWHEKNALVY